MCVKKTSHNKKNKSHEYILYIQHQKHFFATKKPAQQRRSLTK